MVQRLQINHPGNYYIHNFHLKLHICIISITEYLWYNNSNLLGRHTRYVHNKKFALQSRLRRLVLVGTPSPRGASYRAGGTERYRGAPHFGLVLCRHGQAQNAKGFFFRFKKFALQSRLRRLVLVGTPTTLGAGYRAVGAGDARRVPPLFLAITEANFTLLLDLLS